MLHIVNGDSATETLRQSGTPGEFLAFREVLQEGPTPENLSADEWRSTRARFLAEGCDLDIEACLKELLEQQEAIARFRNHEEVTLWFSHDLCCQIDLIYLLNWFSEQDCGGTRLSLICIDAFHGVDVFSCFGQLSAAQMAPLFDQRHEVTGAELELAAKAWAAYRSSTPEALLYLLNGDSSALPYLRGAFLRHLARFPSTNNGLGYIQNRSLQLISEGHAEFKSLFPLFGKSDPAYGLGDAQFWSDLLRMSHAKEPLVIIKRMNDPTHASSLNGYHDAAFELTDEGEAVLAGKSDFIKNNGIDRWFGGVHMTQANLWRWDEQNQSVIRELRD